MPKVGRCTVTATIFQAARINPEEKKEDIVCPNTQQNIVIIRTPRRFNADRYMVQIQIDGTTSTPTKRLPAKEDPLLDGLKDENIVSHRSP